MVAMIKPAASVLPLKLYWADRWNLGAAADWDGDGIPEPVGVGVLVDVFRSRWESTWRLPECILSAGRDHGPGELMLVDANGVGVAGPWPVLGLKTGTLRG